MGGVEIAVGAVEMAGVTHVPDMRVCFVHLHLHGCTTRLSNCLNLHNSTVVLASQQEMDYLNYM